MHPDAATIFLKNKEGIIGNNKIIIPYKVYEEIEKLENSTSTSKVKKAKTARQVFQELYETKTIEVKQGEDETFVDNLFNVLFTKLSLKYNLCLITQDKALSEDILQIKKSKSVKYRKSIIVLNIEKGGSLKPFSPKQKEKPNAKTTSINRPVFPFAEKAELQDVKNQKPLTATELPKEDSWVFVDNRKKPIKLTKKIAEGAEGIIYETNYEKYVCKIFRDEHRTSFKQAKLKLMTSRNLFRRGICWPSAIVYNTYAEFVGYAMPKARGVEIQKSIFIKPLFLEWFNGWKKTDLVEICIDLLHKIRILHEHNVLIGDINPRNILVTEKKKTFFVDTDSYQVEGYPCSVGSVNFTAPEIQNKEFGQFLRTREHEKFAVATLLFMILIPGKTPYSQQGGVSPAKNIIKRIFPYPFGKIRSLRVPQGPWRFIWSHLPYYLKEAFFNLFQKGERLTVEDWIALLKRYRSDLKKGFVSNEIYQQSLKEMDTKQ